MVYSRYAIVACVMCSSLWSAAVRADDSPQASQGQTTKEASKVDAAFHAAPVDPNALEKHRAGSGTTVVIQTGEVQANTAWGVTSGNNTISSGAFSDATGLPTVIQNSGNNVLIQNSTVVDVQFK